MTFAPGWARGSHLGTKSACGLQVMDNIIGMNKSFVVNRVFDIWHFCTSGHEVGVADHPAMME